MTRLRNESTDAVSQSGTLNDDTGEIPFVSWRRASLPELEEGNSYCIEGAVVEDWNGKLRLNMNDRTEVHPLDRDVDIRGSLPVREVDEIIPESGLIERCPECRRALVNDHCPVHLDVEPVHDLRVKARTSDGDTVIFGGDTSEEVLELTVEEALELSEREIEKRIEERIVGTKMRLSLYPIAEEKNIFGVDSMYEK